MLLSLCATPVRGQEEFDETADDATKIFNQGQAMLQRGASTKSKEDLTLAIEFFDQAIKLRDVFPEAEYQRALALAALDRTPDAEKGFRRALEQRPQWPLPPTSLGLLLSRVPARAAEAEELLRQALELDTQNMEAMVAIAELRMRANDPAGAVGFLRLATSGGDMAPLPVWFARAEAERTLGERDAARKSYTNVLRMKPGHTVARFRRAEIYFEAQDFERAARDLAQLEETWKPDLQLALGVASLYARMDRKRDARRVLDALPDDARRSPEGARMRAALDGVDCDPAPEARAALEKLLESEPTNAPLLACLGEMNRTSEPARALEYFRRANEADSSNPRYATGYAAALVQMRKFPEAAGILRRVIQLAPNDYAARANFATALYEMGLFEAAITEYNWMASARPDLPVIYFFIGSARDKLGQYTDALAAYELFLARADASANGLEIGKVKLRLPSLRNQIKLGQGVKKKKGR